MTDYAIALIGSALAVGALTAAVLVFGATMAAAVSVGLCGGVTALVWQSWGRRNKT